MKREDRAKIIIERLADLYPNPPIPLDHSDSYTLLVAVVLSAQSTDRKVNEITPGLFSLAKTPKEMLTIGEQKILEKIREIGLANTKARNIYNLSKLICDNFDNKVPRTFAELESLPGVGHKTASVVMAQAYGIPAFPVDTHIHRLAQRWGLTNGENVRQTEKDLKKLFPKNMWNKLHLQIIFYGRDFCTARGCDGKTCSLCKELYPNRRNPFIHKKA